MPKRLFRATTRIGYTTNQALDGKFRRIKITLNNAEAKIDYRQGYYSNKTFNKFTLADKERQLEDALMLGIRLRSWTIALELEYFQLTAPNITFL